jgi:hypothetical protein
MNHTDLIEQNILAIALLWRIQQRLMQEFNRAHPRDPWRDGCSDALTTVKDILDNWRKEREREQKAELSAGPSPEDDAGPTPRRSD